MHTGRKTAGFASLTTKPKGITGNYEIRYDSVNMVLVKVGSLQHIKPLTTKAYKDVA
jgi:hypothetical protein